LTTLTVCVMTAKIGASQSGSLLQHRNLSDLTVSCKILQHAFSWSSTLLFSCRCVG